MESITGYEERRVGNDIPRGVARGVPIIRRNVGGSILIILIIRLSISVIVIALVSLIGDSGLEGLREGKKGTTVVGHLHLLTHYREYLHMHTCSPVNPCTLMTNRHKRKKVV